LLASDRDLTVVVDTLAFQDEHGSAGIDEMVHGSAAVDRREDDGGRLQSDRLHRDHGVDSSLGDDHASGRSLHRDATPRSTLIAATKQSLPPWAISANQRQFVLDEMQKKIARQLREDWRG
jgi:hypothetical protein